MSEYRIITDSGCDIEIKTLDEWGVECVDLSYRWEGKDALYTNRSADFGEFYGAMRKGEVARTSAVNPEDFKEVFVKALEEGTDILYLGFSSGLSTTVSSGSLAAKELKEKYPERTIKVIDSLCASAGQGLFVYESVRLRDKGASLDENYGEMLKLVPELDHWFTVDDLVYLKRGGRINAASAFVATVLNIKPVLHVDDEGHLINVNKVRGRRSSIRALADKYSELALDPDNGVYFISHGDCIDDARALEEMIEKKHGHKAAIITYVGAVIGAHSGPGTLALFFLGKHR